MLENLWLSSRLLLAASLLESIVELDILLIHVIEKVDLSLGTGLAGARGLEFFSDRFFFLPAVKKWACLLADPVIKAKTRPGIPGIFRGYKC